MLNVLEDVKTLLSYLPQSNKEIPKDLEFKLQDEIRDNLSDIVPDNC